MSILIDGLNLLALAGLVWWLWKQDWETALKGYFLPALLLKLGCGVLLGVLYFHFLQEGDTLLYQRRGQWASELFSENGIGAYLRYLFLNDAAGSRLEALEVPYYDSAWNMVKLFSIPMVLTQGSYYLSSFYLSLFSFAGLWFLVNAITRYFPATAIPALIAFLLFPSVAFWSSGVIKESFIMGGMGLMLGSFLHLLCARNRQLLYLLLFGVGIYVIWLVKYFVAIALALTLVLSLLLKGIFFSERLSRFHWSLKLLALLVLFAAIGLGASQLNPNLHVEALPEAIYRNYQQGLLLSVDKPRIDFPFLEPTYLSFLLHSQLAFAGILFRPFIWEAYNVLSLAAAVENTVLLLLVFGFLRDLFSESRWKWGYGYLLIALLVYVFVMGTLLAYSMPNLGTLNRYRVVIVPFLVYLLLLCRTNRSALQKLIPRRLVSEESEAVANYR